MTDTGGQPAWSGVIHHCDTREEAIAAALLGTDDGDELTIHQDGCVMGYTDVCDCQPEVRVVAVGLA